MIYENRPGTGKLFKREKRGPNYPDWGGPFFETIGGVLVEREIAAWEKSSKNGEKYFSVQVKDKFEPNRSQPTVGRELPGPVKSTDKAFNDEIPW